MVRRRECLKLWCGSDAGDEGLKEGGVVVRRTETRGHGPGWCKMSRQDDASGSIAELSGRVQGRNMCVGVEQLRSGRGEVQVRRTRLRERAGPRHKTEVMNDHDDLCRYACHFE